MRGEKTAEEEMDRQNTDDMEVYRKRGWLNLYSCVRRGNKKCEGRIVRLTIRNT